MVITPIEFVDIPTVDDIDVGITKNVVRPAPREAEFYNFTLVNTSMVTLPIMPFNVDWVEVWHNNWRVINTDPQSPRYIINGNQIILNDIDQGLLTVVVEINPLPYHAASIIRVTNVQRDSYGRTSLFCEPVIMSQPQNGYIRLTADRQSIAYVPNFRYIGTDTFLWTLITQNGQMGQAKCARVKVF